MLPLDTRESVWDLLRSPAGDAGPVARTGSDLYVNVHRNRCVRPGVAGVYVQRAVSGLTRHRQVSSIGKVVLRAGGRGVGAQGHAQGQDKRQGNNTNFFLHGDQAFSHL